MAWISAPSRPIVVREHNVWRGMDENRAYASPAQSVHSRDKHTNLGMFFFHSIVYGDTNEGDSTQKLRVDPCQVT